MKQVIKPMLAVEVDFNKLRYLVCTQPKLDGIRVVVKDGVVYSRSLKVIPNKHVQALFIQLIQISFGMRLCYKDRLTIMFSIFNNTISCMSNKIPIPN